MRGFCVALFISALFFSAPSIAQTNQLIEEVTKCAKVDNDIARLQCFDRAPNRFLSEMKKERAATGEWRRRTDVDPIDDTVTTILVVNDQNGVNSILGTKNHKFILRCSGENLKAFIIWAQDYGDGPLKIVSRVGKDSAKIQTWASSSKTKASFFPGNTSELLYELLHSHQFVVRIPYSPKFEKEITAIFDISGLKHAAKQMLTACPPSKPMSAIFPDNS